LRYINFGEGRLSIGLSALGKSCLMKGGLEVKEIGEGKNFFRKMPEHRRSMQKALLHEKRGQFQGCEKNREKKEERKFCGRGLTFSCNKGMEAGTMLGSGA